MHRYYITIKKNREVDFKLRKISLQTDASLQQRPVTITAASYNYSRQLQLQRPVTVTAVSHNYSGQLQLQRPFTLTAASYNYSGQLQLQRPVTITAASYSYSGQLQLQRPVTITAASYNFKKNNVRPIAKCNKIAQTSIKFLLEVQSAPF
jgi:hypothetical protein